jgi:hypothetical protein
VRELTEIISALGSSTVGHLVARLTLDLVLATVVIRLIYNRLYRDRDYVFTYYVLNVITFCLCFLLSRVSAQLGLGLALFGVFGILRYRTEQIGIRDLTYFFIVIGLGVLNGVANETVPFTELLVIDGVIVTTTALLERGSYRGGEDSRETFYDQLELLRPGNEEKLYADLSARTGLAVHRVEVKRLDLLRDAAEITVFSPYVR